MWKINNLKLNKKNNRLLLSFVHKGRNDVNQTTFSHNLQSKQNIQTIPTTKYEGEQKIVTVLGGGISGLSFAYFLLKEAKETQKNIKVILLEQKGRVGGWMKTTRNKYGVLEEGPRSIRFSSQAYNTIKLVKDIGLEQELVAGDIINSKNRIIYAQNQFWQLPKSLLQLLQFKLIPKTAFLKIIFKQLFLTQKFDNDVSIEEFFKTHTTDEVTENLISAMCLGIFAGNYKQLSMKSCFNDMYEVGNEQGSLFRGILMRGIKSRSNLLIGQYMSKKKKQISNLDNKQNETSNNENNKDKIQIKPDIMKSGIFSFKNGISTLPETIISHLQSAFGDQFQIHYHSSVSSIKTDQSNSLQLTIDQQNNNQKNSFKINSDYLISAIPSHELAKIVQSNNENLSNLLKRIPFATVGVANVAFDSIVDTPLRGFGYLIPPNQNRSYLGTTFDSMVFGEQKGSDKHSKFTFMFGGDNANEEQRELMNDIQLGKKDAKSVFLPVIRNHLQITSHEPSYLQSHVHINAIPQYRVGHKELVEKIEKEVEESFVVKNSPRLFVLGNSYYGVGIVDCINNAHNLSHQFLRDNLKM